MKAELNINTEELVREITKDVVKALKPMLAKGLNAQDTILTVESLAKFLQVSKQWVYERVNLNEIPYIKMGKFTRFNKGEIDNWLDSMKTPALQSKTKIMKIIK